MSKKSLSEVITPKAHEKTSFKRAIITNQMPSPAILEAKFPALLSHIFRTLPTDMEQRFDLLFCAWHAMPKDSADRAILWDTIARHTGAESEADCVRQNLQARLEKMSPDQRRLTPRLKPEFDGGFNTEQSGG